MALKLIALIKEPYKIFIYVAMHFGYFPKMKDETYVKLAYRAFAGKRLDLTNPQTYDEKLQWLKLYDRNPMHRIQQRKRRILRKHQTVWSDLKLHLQQQLQGFIIRER